MLILGGCGGRQWTDAFSHAPPADVAAIETMLNRINDAYRDGSTAGARAVADANYYAVTGRVTKTECEHVWLADPTFFSFVDDTLEPQTITATPNVVPPDLGSVPLGRIYLFTVQETARYIGESSPGRNGPTHQSPQKFHATVMPDGSALLFISCAGDVS